MTRVTLFRGRAANGDWYTGDLLHMRGLSFIAPTGTDFFVQVIPATVGECVGLPDSTKRLLFEGDITMDQGGLSAIVVWVSGGFYLDFGEGIDLQSFIDYDSDTVGLTIIGTIHDTSN